MGLSVEEVQRLFSGPGGAYRFARWGRPIVPVVFGVDEATLSVVKGAVEAVVGLAGHKMAETDFELGANLMLFFFSEWDELLEVPNLDRLVDGLGPLVARLKAQDAHHYRQFRFDEAGAIRACFSFVRIKGALADMPAEALALNEAALMILCWSERAFGETSPLAMAGGVTVLRPDVASVIRAAYDAALPAAASDASHALRLSARITLHHARLGVSR
ncbi:MAG: hypothetical protein WA784_04415 [Albidovulum sp.]